MYRPYRSRLSAIVGALAALASVGVLAGTPPQAVLAAPGTTDLQPPQGPVKANTPSQAAPKAIAPAQPASQPASTPAPAPAATQPTRPAVTQPAQQATPAATAVSTVKRATEAMPAPGASLQSVREAHGPSEADELTALQRQLVVWKAKAELAKYQAEVKRAEQASTAATIAPTAPGQVAGQAPAPTPMRSPSAADSTRLVSLRAFDGRYSAVLDVDGKQMPVRAGDTIEDGWKVGSIDETGVKLVNNKRVRVLRP
ncbi:hypothetical protein LMG7143_04441 [Ralstonia thomasii]|nr:hypothetical protein LMG7143_04441 [Ralstonia sp. LMG 18095]